MNEASLESLRPSSLRTAWLGRALRVLDETASTNTALAQWASEGAPHGATLVAARQSAGRGRQGRRWISPPGNLYVSWLARPARTMPEMAPLSLVVGLGVVDVLREATGLDEVGLKWPNDVWIGLRKVGGVLLESRVHPTPTIVVGLGLDLFTPAFGWDPELRGRATSLDEHGVVWTPGQALDALLPRFEHDYERFVRAGLADFSTELREFSVLDGRRVGIERNGVHEIVEVITIDSDGGLRVRSDTGTECVVYAGEVHLGETWS